MAVSACLPFIFFRRRFLDNGKVRGRHLISQRRHRTGPRRTHTQMNGWKMEPASNLPDHARNRNVCLRRQILGYINPWMTLKGPGATCTVARETLDVFMGLLLMSNRISQANRCVSGYSRLWKAYLWTSRQYSRFPAVCSHAAFVLAFCFERQIIYANIGVLVGHV